MNTVVKAKGGLIVGILAVLLLVGMSAAPVQAYVNGIPGTTFNLVAKQDYISSPDGDSILMWGYANGVGNPMQYPGPTLIVQQGADRYREPDQRIAGGPWAECLHRFPRARGHRQRWCRCRRPYQ